MHSRSLMNVIFDPIDQKFGKKFAPAAEQEGFLGFEGHRTRGGFRASLYNAVSLEDVNELIEFMRNFENNYSYKSTLSELKSKHQARNFI